MDIVKYDTITNLSDEQRVIPLFTLNSLLMPGEKMFMRVFEPRYKQMLDDVSIDNLPYGHVMANPSMATLNGWSTPYDVGTLVNVERMEEQGTNLLYDAMGGKRFTIISLIEPALPPENFGSIFPSVDELEDNYLPDAPDGKLYSRALIELMPPLIGEVKPEKWNNILNLWEFYVEQIVELTGISQDVKEHITEMKDIFSKPTEESIWMLSSMVVDTTEGQVSCLKAKYVKEIASIIESNIQMKINQINIFREKNE